MNEKSEIINKICMELINQNKPHTVKIDFGYGDFWRCIVVEIYDEMANDNAEFSDENIFKYVEKHSQ